MTDPHPLLSVADLAIAPRGEASAFEGLSLDVHPGETVGLAGPSGAGKTLTAHAILGLLPTGAALRGRMTWRGQDLAELSDGERRALRGREIALVPQDPMTALHPYRRIDRQVAEAVRVHRPDLSRAAALARAATLLEETGLPGARLRSAGYPFQWSGGMRQRALIAMAIAHNPALLIADEPTTALDATTRVAIMQLLERIRREHGSALLLITHDTDVLFEMADRVVPMPGCTLRRHRPRVKPRSSPRPDAADVLRVDALTVEYPLRDGFLSRRLGSVRAVVDAALRLAAGETLAVVGASGAGKSTLARALVGLERPSAGRITVAGLDVVGADGDRLAAVRRLIQIVFQDPYSSLNPRRRIGETIAQPLYVHGLWHAAGGTRRIDSLLERVRLQPSLKGRLPHQLSGGERQRVAIARALALDPRVLVLDEPFTALDHDACEAVLDVLIDLRAELGTSLVLVAHDLRLVRDIADRVLVMHDGRIVEQGTVDEIFTNPRHPCTRGLVAATPRAG